MLYCECSLVFFFFSLVRVICTIGFTDYHERAGTVISAGLALFQVRPMLAIKSLTQHAPPGLLSHAVYITAAEKTGQMRVLLWTLLWCKLAAILRCTAPAFFFSPLLFPFLIEPSEICCMLIQTEQHLPSLCWKRLWNPQCITQC